MEEIIINQDANAAALQQAITNYKKAGAERKTVEFINTKEQEIDALWQRFASTDKKIRSDPIIPEDHPYHKRDLFNIIGVKYNDIKAKIKADLTAAMTVSEAGPSKKPASSTLITNPHSEAGPSKKQVSTTLSTLIAKQKKVVETVQRMLNQLIHDTDSRSKQFYAIKIKTIEQHWRHAQQIHEQIWSSSEDTKLYDFDNYVTTEEKINEGILHLHEKMNNSITDVISHHPERKVEAPTGIRLPKIEIPIFNGDYLKWRQFKDLFTELIHSQPLAACQKMWYLKTSMSGEAAKLIQHFTTTDENYEAAWKIINNRFENKRLLVNALLQKLLSQSPCLRDNASSIKTLHDTTMECLLGLQSLDIDTTSWDPLLIHIFTQHLDRATHILWEQSMQDPREISTIKQFLAFLELRFQSLEALGLKHPYGNGEVTKRQTNQGLNALISTKNNCIACKQDHPLYRCAKFLSLTINQRLKLVQAARYCVNCFKADHNAKQCTSGTCTKCHNKHNTLLHLESSTNQPRTVDNSTIHQEVRSAAINQAASLAAVPHKKGSSVLLSTVLITVEDDHGRQFDCRAILDNGSQMNFITKSFVQKLGIQTKPQHVNIRGIGQSRSTATERVNIKISSKSTGFSSRMEAQILPNIVSNQPIQFINIDLWNLPKNIQLADPQFNKPNKIDLLVGAGLFYSLLSVGQIKLGDDLPVLQNTLLGWVLGGEYNSPSNPATLTCGISTDDELNDSVEKFWEIEECDPNSTNLTAAEIRCENYFNTNTRHDAQGRYVVRLPFQRDSQELGASYDVAAQRFKAIERRLTKDSNLKEQYVNFMREYQQLGHMEAIRLNDINGPHYFLPHHAVLKPDSTTTKLRVVFDASAKTSTNRSLNDILATGPTVQDDVFTILLRFRFPRYVFTADIEKMYRQIWIHPEDQKFQLILWREDATQPLQCFQLKTVTYGTTSAPYLATRCLKKLAEDNAHRYPLAANAIKSNFYVDDVLCGADHIKTAMQVQEELRTLLKNVGFNLRKWSANDQRLIRHIHPEDQQVSLDFNPTGTTTVKTMGLSWNPKDDIFTVKAEKPQLARITKRTALGDISRIFDPLGLMAPITIVAKMFLQKLWKLKLDWDAALPQDLHTIWVKFREELKQVECIKIPRHVFGHHLATKREIHIFADASEEAYGAVSYVRSMSPDNTIIVRLLCAKSRVRPIKQISLPRLELCAAKLAVDLMRRLQKDLNLTKEDFHLWSDSTAVLGWINADSSHYHTFIANRISAIQQTTSPNQWRHVYSKENPADLLSRGVNPSQLADNNLWFYGPMFLHAHNPTWKLMLLNIDDCPLEKKEKFKITLTSNVDDVNSDVFMSINHKNCFRRLQRIIAYMLRFTKGNKTGLNGYSTSITVPEAENALVCIIKYLQKLEFSEEIRQLTSFKALNNNSSLSSLTPFIDNNELLRVGGRIQTSCLSFDAKHPIVLPYRHPFTKLLIESLHKEHLHAGPQTLLSICRQRFWPVKGMTLMRSVVHNCVQCTKVKPKLFQQLMGNLPQDRVQPARPFVKSGVDFFGPIHIHYKIRGKKPTKAYVAVFCCFATKAVHLELVGDLTTESFIGALKRFMGRRGHCNTIYCDNATNFIGARNYLAELSDIIHSQEAKNKILSACTSQNIEFKFIPPRAPHFGGLWEAAVKSAKSLLVKALSSASLTYEEMETIVIEAESIMNSRPITPLSSDPNDLTALTPGHFLIGEPLTATIDPNSKPNNANLLNRWKLVTHLKTEFWRRWSNEYLHHLQHRYRWKQECHNIKTGLMVLIKEDNLPPLKWPLGRIVKVITGEDGLIRVADVRTTSSIIRRPIHRLAPLPVEETSEETTAQAIRSRKDGHPKNTKASIRSEATLSTTNHSNRRDNSQDEIRSKRRREHFGSTLVTILLVCLFLPGFGSEAVEVQSFKADPGIYFEQMGFAHIISSDWTLVNYFELRPYWQEFKTSKIYTKTLNRICEFNKNSTPCLKTIGHIQHLMSIIEANNQLLKVPVKRTRSKRGALNFVGNVANSLFGVLDSEYADQLAVTINNLKQNDNNLALRIGNATTFIDQTLSIMKKDQESIEKEFNTVEKLLHQINLKLTQLTQEIHTQEFRIIFNEIAIQAHIHLSNFQRMQESLLDILTDAHHGVINPDLLSPEELQYQLDAIQTNCEKTLKLPMPTADILKYYQFMSISHCVIDNYIIFNIKIPLTTPEQYELLRLISIPWFQDGSFVKIQLSTFNLMVDLHRNQYYPLSTTEIQKCIIVDQKLFFCRQSHPLYHSGSPVNSCEMKLLQMSKKDLACPIVPAGKGPHWYQLQQPNSWIFALAQETTLNVVCDFKPSQLTLNNVGILKIEEGCVIKEPHLTIHGHRILTTRRYVSYTPTINVSELVDQSPTTLLVNTNYTQNYRSHQHDIQLLKDQVVNLQRISLNAVRPHDIHHYGLGYFLLITICVGAIIILTRLQRNSKPTSSAALTEIENVENTSEPEIITVYGS